MVKVKVLKNNDQVKEISIEGHAKYDEYGKDIVCASVSSIAITTINAIVKINKNSIQYKEENGYLLIKILNTNEVVNVLIENMIELLQQLAKQYSKNIKIY